MEPGFFRQRRPRTRIFPTAAAAYTDFSGGGGRCDRFRPKIVKIGLSLAIFQPFEISRVGTTQCRVWEPRNVMFGKTQCPAWERHIVLFGKDTMSCVGVTQCLFGNESYGRMSGLGKTQCPVWVRRNVLFGHDTRSCSRTKFTSDDVQRPKIKVDLLVSRDRKLSSTWW